jgi:YVTN family beta-propeller protein
VRPPSRAGTVLAAALLATACSTPPAGHPSVAAPPHPHTPTDTAMPSSPPLPTGRLPGMPPPLDPADLYAADRPGHLSARVRHDKPLIYVPNFGSGTVSIIDPVTLKVIHTQRVGNGPQHVVPSWDLRTLWVNNNSGNSLTPINPVNGTFGKPVKVEDPDNLYFTPDRHFAVVTAESKKEIVFRDPHTTGDRPDAPGGRSPDAAGHQDLPGRPNLVRGRHANRWSMGTRR